MKYSEFFLKSMQTTEPLESAEDLTTPESKEQLSKWMREIVKRNDAKRAVSEGFRIR